MVRLIGLLGLKGAGKDTAAEILISRLGFVGTSFAAALYQEVGIAYGVTVGLMENRLTKETSLLKLKLANCVDADFVRVALEYLSEQTRQTSVPHWAPGVLQPVFRALGAAKARLFRRAALEAPRSPRWVLQLWGTEYRRQSRFGRDSYWIDQVDALIAAQPECNFVIKDVRTAHEADFVEGRGGVLARVRRPTLEAQEAQDRAAGIVTALHSSETELLTREVRLELVNREGEPGSLAEGLSELFPDLAQAA